jgi:hypothetical protein
MSRSAAAFLCTSLCAMTLCSAEISKNCGHSELHMRASARYTTPKGIGYNDGYTTLEGFFSSNPCDYDSWLPFLDLRGHVFDNGKLAANAGLGLRYLSKSRVWGGNVYYDYRNTKRQHYNQAAAGFESLGRVWDFRINGYLPVGWKQSPHFHTGFHSFSGNSLLIKYKKDFAMKGANAEAGYHLDYFRQAPLYFAAGPYYLTGKGKTTWGGELRATVEFFHRYFKLEGNTSYDHFFKWVGQGQVSVNIPLGKRCKLAENETCTEDRLFARAIQRIDRHEIIPVGRQKIVTPANNPETGQPWVFWFVDNTSHSLGTFEDPFPTLLGAQNASSANQGIYVFPGNGTTNGMSGGIVLQNGQPFLGASVAHSIPTTNGTVLIPAMASTMPNIANTTGAGNVVTLGSNNTVSGFHIATNVDHTANGIFGNGISNLIAENNTFTSPTSITTNGISLNNCFGQILVENNTFDGFTANDGSNNGNGIYVASGTMAILNVAGNNFTNTSDPSLGNGGSGIYLNGSTITTFNSLDNTFSDFGINGSGIFNSNSTITTFNSAGNTFSNFSNSSEGIINSGSTITTFNAAGNTFSNFSNSSDGITNSGGTITTFILSGNTFSGSSIEAVVNSNPIIAFYSSDNTFNLLGNGIHNQSTTIGTFSSYSDTFNINNGFCIISNVVTTFSCLNDTFNMGNATTGIAYQISNNQTNARADISGNTFIVNTPSNSVATSINVASGTLCLNFTDNTATITTTPTYVFQNTGRSFNSTSNSTTSANTGTFSIGSGVNFPGTCSLKD